MKKIAKILASFAALAFVVAPAVPASAYKADAVVDGAITVSTDADLKQALDDATVKTITLGADIQLDSSAVIDMDGVTLDGAGHTISVPEGKDPVSVDGDNYAIKIYASGVTVKNVKTGGTAVAGIQVDETGKGAVLEGNIDLDGAHKWGGIELQAPADMTKANITFKGENATTPAIWSDDADMTTKSNSVKAAAKAQKDGKKADQLFLYVDAKNAPTADAEGFVSVKALNVDDYRVTPIADEQEPTPETPETPEVTEPVEDETPATDEADVTAPNTGTTIANFALVLTGITVAVLTAVYATRFASAKK